MRIEKNNNIDIRRYLNITLLIFMVLFSVNTAYAKYGNDNMGLIDGGPLGVTIRVSDPDGIRWVVAYKWNPDDTAELEHDAGTLDCPVTYDIWFGRAHLAHDHRYYITDCQKPPSGGIWEQKAGSLEIERYLSSVGQGIGIRDSKIDKLDEQECRGCHNSTYMGGVPDRHHFLVSSGKWSCTNCHPVVSGPSGQSVLIERNCLQCHNGTSWRTNSSGVNISRPHHIKTLAAQTRQCDNCHGSLVDNYDDGHYMPPYNTSMVTPYADNKIYNESSKRYWGGCLGCHQPTPQFISTDVFPSPWGIFPISNYDTHHSAILGNSSGTDHQTDQTTGAECNWCHIINTSSGDIARIIAQVGQGGPLNEPSITYPYGRILEFRNSSVDTINGTACEKCHSVQSIHNIQWNYSSTNGHKGWGHIGDNWDCNGCHAFWDAGSQPVPGEIIPDMSEINPSVLMNGVSTIIAIEGTNFLQDTYNTTVSVDEISYTPTSITDSQIVVTIPSLTPGKHEMKVVKGSVTSKLYPLTVVTPVKITIAKLKSGVITIIGSGFGTKPVQDEQQYITIEHAGNIYYSQGITSWSNTKIIVKVDASIATIGDTVTVTTATGKASAKITK